MATAIWVPQELLIDPLTNKISVERQRFYQSLADGITTVPWNNINFTGSSLVDIITKSAAELNSGTLALARLSGITTTQLAAAAGILGSQLAAAAGITLAQLALTGTLDSSHFLNGAGAFATITKAAFATHSFSAVGAGATNFLGFASFSATETIVRWVCPVAGTLRNLYASAEAAPGAGQTFAYTIRKNAASTSVTCTTSGAVATASNDTSNSASVAAGDLVTVQLVTSAGAAVQRHTAAFEVATA